MSEHVTDEELAAFLAVDERDELTLIELQAHERQAMIFARKAARELRALRTPLDDIKEAQAWEALKAIEAKIAPCDWGFNDAALLIPETHWRDGAWLPEEFQFIATIRNLYPWLRIVIDRALVWRDNLNAALAQVDRLTLKAGKSEAELAVLRAPVDVEGEVERAARRITQTVLVTAFKDDEGRVVVRLSEERTARAVRPHVERAAQLAREAEGLRADLSAVERTIPEAYRYSKPHLSIAAILGELDGMTADLAAARAEHERLKTDRTVLTIRAVLPGGVHDGQTYPPFDARHAIRLDGDDVQVSESWHDPDGHEQKRYEVRLSFAQLVHLALNTTPEERAAIDARADWRGVPEQL